MSDPVHEAAMRALLSCTGTTHRDVAIAAAREAFKMVRAELDSALPDDEVLGNLFRLIGRDS